MSRCQRRQRSKRSRMRRMLIVAAGVALVTLGAIMMFAPGPGMLVLLIGAGLLAEESERVARWLDALEVLLRRVVSRIVRRWRGAGRPVRWLIVLCAAILTAGAAMAAWDLLVGPEGWWPLAARN